MVSCLSRPPPSPDPPNPLFESTLKFKTTLSFPLPLYPVLVFVFFFLVFGGIRVPSKSLFVERDDHLRTLHIGFLRRHQVGFVGIFPAQNTQTNSSDCHLTRADILTPPNRPQQLFRRWCSSFNSCPAVAAHTNHFMRNMSSPVESVAPIILSGDSPRAKPRSFSVWGSNNKIQLQSSTKYLTTWAQDRMPQ